MQRWWISIFIMSAPFMFDACNGAKPGASHVISDAPQFEPGNPLSSKAAPSVDPAIEGHESCPTSRNGEEMNELLKRLRADTHTLDEYNELRNEIRDFLQTDLQNKTAFFRQLLQESNIDMKLAMLNLIGETGDSFFVPNLTTYIEQENSVELVQTAATVLGKIGGPEVLSILKGLLNRAEPNVRYGAVRGLHCLRSPESVALLLRLLDDETVVSIWWPSPFQTATVGEAAQRAIDDIVGFETHGDIAVIQRWLASKGSERGRVSDSAEPGR